MGIFKNDQESKRVIFNVRLDLAERLEAAKNDARLFGKKLDIDAAVDEAIEKFLKKAEKRLADMKKHKASSESGKKKKSGKEKSEKPDVDQQQALIDNDFEVSEDE